MKSIAYLALIALSTLASLEQSNAQSSNAGAAQRNDSNMLTQGRFLKRLRDEAAAQQKNQPSSQADAVPAEARERSRSQGPNGLTPAPSEVKQTSVLSPRQDPRAPSAIPVSQPPRNPANSTANPRNAGAQQPARDDQRSGPKPVGFGWKIDERNDRLIVTHVDRGGNAEKVGVKPGDVVLEMGGIPIGSLDEYRQIVTIFGEGDEIAVRLERGNRPYERELRFGAGPDVDAEQIVSGGSLPSANPAASRQPGLGSSAQGVTDFAPPIVTPATNQPPRGTPGTQNFPPGNGNRSTPPARQAGSPHDQEIQRLQNIVRQQQELIRQLQQELETLKKRNNPANSRGIFGR